MLEFEDRIYSMESDGLCLGSECDNTPVIVAQDNDGFSVESGMEDLLDGTEETVAIYKSVHGSDGTGPMDNRGDHAPNIEVIILRNHNLGIIGIGRNEPVMAVVGTNELDGVLSVKLAHGHLVLGRVPVALVHYKNVTAVDVRVYHGVTLHTDKIRSLGIRAEHSQHVYLLGFLIVVKRYRESCPYLHIEGREYKRDDVRSRVHLADTREVRLLSFHVLPYASDQETGLVRLIVDVVGNLTTRTDCI